MVRTEIYGIAGVPAGRLAVRPRPRGGDWLEDEINALRAAGVDALLSLLTRDEMEELDLMKEAECCATVGMQFDSFPIADRGVPCSRQEVLSLVQRLVPLLNAGRGLAIHCRQGVGRSALVTACVLAALGEPVAVCFERIALARGRPVPDTADQREWVKAFADAHLTGRRGGS